jgi:hypothetical protein
MEIRRRRGLDQDLFYRRRMALPLASLVRVRDQHASLRVPPEPGTVAEFGMKAAHRQLVWRFLASIGMIVATVGVATMVARWAGPY